MESGSQSQNIELYGVKGWLLVYVITSIIGIAWLALDSDIMSGQASLLYKLYVASQIGLRTAGLYLIFALRKPITQSFHIWINVILAGSAAFIVSLDDSWSWTTGFDDVIVHTLWASYWIASQRVRATFCAVRRL